jgi:ketosteroid isomerase-like protein
MRLLAGLLIAVSAFGADSVQTLMKLDEQFCRDFAARGVDGWMSWFAEDAVVFRPDGPVIRTKAEATAHYRKVFPPGQNSLRWKPLGGMISSASDLGFTYGTWESKGRTGKYLTTWKKQKDGSWKIVADIGNPDEPPKQAATP